MNERKQVNRDVEQSRNTRTEHATNNSGTRNLKDLSIGTLETLKRIPGYEEALENMKTDFLNKEKKKN